MDKFTHTPGPWVAGINASFSTLLDGHYGKAVYFGDWMVGWANAVNIDGIHDNETAVKNAAMFAAAPDMLKELRAVCAMCRCGEIDCEYNSIRFSVSCDDCSINKCFKKVFGEE